MQQIGRNKWRFTASMVQDAPDTRGVYVLWENDAVVCVGRADGGESSIRALLMQQLTSDQAKHVTHYSWEICRDPAAREAELLGHARPRRAEAAGVVLSFNPAQKRSA